MKIGATGAKGFIGRYMVKYLKDKGYEVLIGSKDNCDVTNVKSLEKFIKQCDVIIHLATYQNVYDKNYKKFENVNVNGTYNLLKLADKYRKRVILLSSEVVYKNGNDCYTRSKKAQLEIAKNYKNVEIVYPPVVLDLNKKLNWWNLAPGGIIAAVGDGSRKINYIEINKLLEYIGNQINGKKVGKLPINTLSKDEFLKLVSKRTGGFVMPFRLSIGFIRVLSGIFGLTKYGVILRMIIDENDC